MTRILVHLNGTPNGNYVAGDVIAVEGANGVGTFGSHEDYDLWIASGRQDADWPGIFVVLDMQDFAPSDLVSLLEPHSDGVRGRAKGLPSSGLLNALAHSQSPHKATLTKGQATALLAQVANHP